METFFLIFPLVVRYADQFEKSKRIETLEKVLPCVRFPLLSSEFLVDHVEENPKLTGNDHGHHNGKIDLDRSQDFTYIIT